MGNCKTVENKDQNQIKKLEVKKPQTTAGNEQPKKEEIKIIDDPPKQIEKVEVQEKKVVTKQIATQGQVAKYKKQYFISTLKQEQIIEIENLDNRKKIFQSLGNNDIKPSTKAKLIYGIKQYIKQTLKAEFSVLKSETNISGCWTLPLASSCFSSSDCDLFQIILEENNEYQYQQLAKNSDKMRKFVIYMKKNIVEAFQTVNQNVMIVNVQKGSLKVDFAVQFLNEIAKKLDTSKEAIIDEARQRLQKMLQMKIIDLTAQKICFFLNENDFDKRGNYKFKDGDHLKRLEEDYFQPKKPWKRIGLNVMGKFENNDWVKKDGNPNEWAVVFHGVREPSGIAVNNITLVGLKQGPAQVYQNDVCKRSGQQIGQGIYCTPKIEIAEEYTTPYEYNGKKYIIAFQCRVRPDAIRECTNQEGYWVINDPIDIRPYGICYKKVS